MARADSKVPDYVTFYTQTEGRGMAPGDPGFLGARFGPMELTTNNIPDYIRKLDSVSELDHKERAELRDVLSKQFTQGRNLGETLGSHNEAYERVRGIMSSEKLFDIEQEPAKVRDRYGPTLFGRQALAARRLVEAGVPFVRVARAWWDSHGHNFESHQEMVPELDHVMATLLDDLAGRGLLEHTLVITLAEFGRTPKFNGRGGRDHWGQVFSVALAGGGINGGQVYGESDDQAAYPLEKIVHPEDITATIFHALGHAPETEIRNNQGRPFAISRGRVLHEILT